MTINNAFDYIYFYYIMGLLFFLVYYLNNIYIYYISLRMNFKIQLLEYDLNTSYCSQLEGPGNKQIHVLT